jgi:hypothetical protein
MFIPALRQALLLGRYGTSTSFRFLRVLDFFVIPATPATVVVWSRLLTRMMVLRLAREVLGRYEFTGTFEKSHQLLNSDRRDGDG